LASPKLIHVRGIFVAVVVAMSPVSLAVAGSAHADANDQQYLNVLNANGLGCAQALFQCPQGDDSMIGIGHAICRQLHGGNSERAIGAQIVRSRPGVQPDQAARLVIAAEAAYCPKD
jgi:hypothetical protein